MSKVVMSLPKGMVKNCLIGGVIALISYLILQFLCAFLIHRELLGFDKLYPMVCIAAAAASFLGCGFSVLRQRDGSMLTVSVVVVVFLTVTLAAAFVTTDAIAIDNGLTGIGLSMAAGGLAAALVGSRPQKNRRAGGRTKRRRRS